MFVVYDQKKKKKDVPSARTITGHILSALLVDKMFFLPLSLTGEKD